MRVLLINNRPANTGIGVYTARLAAALSGPEVAVTQRQWRGRAIEAFYARVVRGRLAERSVLGRIASVMEESARLVSLLIFAAMTPRGNDLYHITSPSLSVIARWRRPCVITVHDTIPFEQPRDGWDALIQRSMLDIHRAAAVIVPTQAVRSSLLRVVPWLTTPITVIPHGVDHDRYMPGDPPQARARLGLPASETIVLHVGSEEPRKNVRGLLDAMAVLRQQRPDALLMRVGEATAEMRAHAAALGITDAVRWVGVLDDDELALAYRAADVFAFPSSTEGFGLPVLEAMASGCPVVAGDSEAVAEVAGGAAILVGASTEALVAGLVEALTPARTEQLRAAGLARAAQFTWAAAAARTRDLYARVLSAARVDGVMGS